MPNSWEEAYSELAMYLSSNPQAKISRSVIKIPEEVRPEFYRLFNAVRAALIKEKFPAILDQAETLSKSYKEVRDEVARLLRLADTEIPDSLNWFLEEPTSGLARVYYHQLFDLLKKKIDTTIFEQVASKSIETSFRDFYRSGYEKWVVLSLVKLLGCDKASNVPAPKLHATSFLVEGGVVPGSREEPVPEVEEAESLSFIHGEVASLVVPDFIARSTKIGKYVAFRTEPTFASWTAKFVSDKREWYNVSSLRKEFGSEDLWPDLVINVDDKPEDIALIADFKRILRPDLIIEYRVQKNWYQREGMKKIRHHHDILKPKMGTYIVSREPVPEQAYRELEVTPEDAASETAPASREPAPEQVAGKPALEEASKEPSSGQEQELALLEEPKKQAVDIHILTVGFDQTRLEPIIAALNPVEENSGEPAD
jgi:hypothetical protein